MRVHHWGFWCSLALACGNDEDVGGSGDSQSTKPPDLSTTSTTDAPTTSATNTLTDSTTSGDDTTTSDDTTSGTPPDPLAVDCLGPPDGAVKAQYMHQPTASGGIPAYTWGAVGLPDGLSMDPNTGLITGVPTTAGVFAPTISVTDGEKLMVETQCPDITINDELFVDLDALPGPCLLAGDSILDYITGGDGSPIVCATPKDNGDGDVPAGITIDPATCEIVGAISETRYGTWAWIVRARQSGNDVYAPYCATQPNQAPNAYNIDGVHSGGAGDELDPLELSFDPAAPLKVDGDADPSFEVTREVCGDSCFFGFFYQLTSSPLGSGACSMDKDKCSGLCPLIPDANEPDGDTQIGCSLVPKMMNPKTGFAHELWSKGDMPSPQFATRPFIQQWSIDYCISSLKDDCDSKADILANGDSSNLEFAVILRPQP